MMALMKSSYSIRRYATILLLTCLSQASCTDSEPTNRCSIASDTVTITNGISVGNQTYYLVHRISGWHEKIESFELYGAEPTFDNCGESTITPLFGASIDNKDSDGNDQYVAHIYFEPPNSFVFDYTPGAPPKSDHYKSLTLEQQNNK